MKRITRGPTSAADAEAAAYWASPVGHADAAKQHGLGFFEIQLEVGASQRAEFGAMSGTRDRTTLRTHTGVLSAIEALGWRLEHVGYVHVVTAESSRDKVFSTGQKTAVSGRTVGIYLFRNTDSA